MSRTTNRKKTPPVKPVQKIELTDKNNKGKLILVILLLALGFTAIGYGLFTAFSTEKGWREIEANNTEELNCSSEFVFMYNIGASGNSPTVENKAITNLYSDVVVDAYKIFTSDVDYEDVNNIYTMNQHPNEEIEVEEALYQAFELLQEFQNRNIYLAPVYAQYDDMFHVTDESEIVNYDPYSNEEVANYYSEVAAYASDPDAVDVKLLGDNKVQLFVSEEYLKYAEENGITRFVDFFWMKNAFVTDYLADAMTSKGYTLGTISSYDGFCRNLDDSDTGYAFNIFDHAEGAVRQAAIMNYSGAQSIVNLRAFMLNDLDSQHYYELKNGEVRTSYLDVTDGMCKSAVKSLVSYSKEKSCAEILLNMIPIYITDTLDKQAVFDLSSKGVYSVYCKDSVIYHNESTLTFSNLYNYDNVSYTTSLMAPL